MNATTSVPTTIQLRPTRLAGLMVAAAAVAAVVTWALLVFAVNQGTENAQRDIASNDAVLSSLTTQQRQYVEGVMALSPAELAAAYGTGRGDVVSTLEPAGAPVCRRDLLDEPRADRRRLRQRALHARSAGAQFRRGDLVDEPRADRRRLRQRVRGIRSLSPEQIAAAYGNVFPTARDAQAQEYIQGIMAATPEELAAAYGR